MQLQTYFEPEIKMNYYEEELSDCWFTLIKLGLKNVEGRLNNCKFKAGDIILFTNNDFGFERNIAIRITEIINYHSFRAYLEGETLSKCLPGVDKIEDGLKIYYKYYKKEDEMKYGVVALHFTLDLV
jgi:ASC-1-like (ASCH) protein